MKTRLTEQFGIRHPVLCAPMALIAGGRLVAAVSDAGGLGILGGGYAGAFGGEPDLEEELRLVEGRKFGVGFISWALDRAPQAFEEALKYSPYCVFLSFGDPQPHANKVHDAKAKLVCQVQTLQHVDQALDAGADAIVAQGTEAGGHGAARSTLPLIPEVADYLAKRAPNRLPGFGYVFDGGQRGCWAVARPPSRGEPPRKYGPASRVVIEKRGLAGFSCR